MASVDIPNEQVSVNQKAPVIQALVYAETEKGALEKARGMASGWASAAIDTYNTAQNLTCTG